MGKPISMMPLQPKPPQAFLFTDLPAVEEMLAKETVYCPHCGIVVPLFPPKDAAKHDWEVHKEKLGEQAEAMCLLLFSPDLTEAQYANLRSNFAGSILQARPDLRRQALLAGWISIVNAPQGQKA